MKHDDALSKIFRELHPATFAEMQELEREMQPSIDRVNAETARQTRELVADCQEAVFKEFLDNITPRWLLRFFPQ